MEIESYQCLHSSYYCFLSNPKNTRSSPHTLSHSAQMQNGTSLSIVALFLGSRPLPLAELAVFLVRALTPTFDAMLALAGLETIHFHDSTLSNKFPVTCLLKKPQLQLRTSNESAS